MVNRLLLVQDTLLFAEAYTSAMVCSGWERRQDGEELQSPPGVSVSTGPASWVLGPGDLSSAL